MMQAPTQRSVATVAALVLLVIACGLGNTSLPSSVRVGNEMTINSPDDWWVFREEDSVILSEVNLDLWDSGEEVTPPVLYVYENFRPDIFSIDRISDLENFAELLIKDIFHESDIGNSDEIRVAGVDWVIVRYSAEEGVLRWGESAEGWIAVCELNSRIHLLLASASPNEWKEYEDVFDAMLRSVRFD